MLNCHSDLKEDATNFVQTFKNIGKTGEMGTKHPWFYKLYQSGLCTLTKDHESNGGLHRYICANCSEKGRQLGHPEKDCLWSKKE